MPHNQGSSAHLHIEDSGGSGRPVVLIHGWPLSGAAWAHQVPALRAAGYRTIAYDRRGFGRSTAPEDAFDYDTLTADLRALILDLDLQEATLVGFSMGGGEVARYLGRHGGDRLRSIIFAAAVPPFLMKTADNPEGPLTPEAAKEQEEALTRDRKGFFDKFATDFFSAGGRLMVPEEERQKAIALCRQSDPAAALGCQRAFSTTDFRNDLSRIELPTLVIHGDADGIVPVEGSGARTHRAVRASRMVVLPGAPHGCNVSHAGAFNAALLEFL